MSENLEKMLSILAEDDLAELKTLLKELPPLEQRFLLGLLENLTPEEVWNFLNTMDADVEDVPCYHFSDPAPYYEGEPAAPGKREIHFDDLGRICVRNTSACWLPELTLRREIGGTIYSVSGSYVGTGALDEKVLRILSHNLENMEESE